MKMTVFTAGFRLFFFLATLFGVFSVTLWGIYYFGLSVVPVSPVSGVYWHAHEMVYGYCMAVIAGFLLTAVKNWTGIKTLTGWPLALAGGLWIGARLAFSLGYLSVAFRLDLAFMIMLAFAITVPVIRARQWKQMAIVSKIFLLMVFNSLFYLEATGYLGNGIYLGVYGGLYLIIGLILMMARRLFPFFVNAATQSRVGLTNSVWLDRFILSVFLGFYIAELSTLYEWSGFFALLLFLANSFRVYRWHCREIWQSPLLWALYVSFWFINLGFLLFSLSLYVPVSRFAALHAMTYGGIGLITLGMMARVSLGHSGRDIYNPPQALGLIFLLLAAGAIIRVLVPLLLPGFYAAGIWLSQLLWVVSFGLFLLTFMKIFFLPRADGKPG